MKKSIKLIIAQMVNRWWQKLEMPAQEMLFQGNWNPELHFEK